MTKQIKKNRKNIDRKAKRLLTASILKLIGRVPVKDRFDGSLKRICILAQEKLGDAILLTPLIGQLRYHFPELEIHVVAYSDVQSFFRYDPNIQAVYYGKADYIRYFQTLKKQQFDLLFNTKDHASFTFLYQSRLIPARFRVGIWHEQHSGFFHHLIDVDFNRHMIEKNCALLQFLNVVPGQGACRPYIPPGPVSSEIHECASAIPKKKCVGINLSAGEKSREWSFEKWQTLISQLPEPIIIFSMPDRLEEKEMLENEFGHVVKTPPTRSIYDVAELMRPLLLLVTPDTALVHAASSTGTPVVGLYRKDPVHLLRFGPYGIPNRQIVSVSSFVEDIGVDDVLANLASLSEELGAGAC